MASLCSSSSGVEAEPYSSRVGAEPYSSRVEAEPYSSRVEAESYSSRVGAESYSSRVEAEPYSSRVEAEPYSSRVEAEPYSSSGVGAEPYSSSGVGAEPYSSRVGAEPYSSRVEAESYSSRVEFYDAADKKCISDVRRTFCLFVTFDLLFITLLWIIELNVNGGIQKQLEREVLQYDYHASFFDIFLLAVFRFSVLILSYAVCKLRHWSAVAVSTAVCCAFLILKVILSKLLSQGAFGYLLPIISFILAWMETWLLDFKVLPQEEQDLNRFRSVLDAAERAPLMGAGPQSDGQFYSPPESVADSDDDLDDKVDPEKRLIQQAA